MAKVTIGRKACAVNPLKMSQPIAGRSPSWIAGGDAAASWLPGVHVVWIGSFRSAFQRPIPLQTTANERSCDRPWRLDNVEQAVLNIYNRPSRNSSGFVRQV